MDGFHGASFLPTRVATAPPSSMPRLTPGALWAAAVTNWTVTEPGATKAPTSNDYDLWNMDQLRKECTARGKKIKRNIEDEGGVRRCWLRENDVERQRDVATDVCGPQGDVALARGIGVGKGVAVSKEVNQPRTHKPKTHTPDSINSSRVVHVVSPGGASPPAKIQVGATKEDGKRTGRTVSTKRVRDEVDQVSSLDLMKRLWDDANQMSSAPRSKELQAPSVGSTQSPPEPMRANLDRSAPCVAPAPPATPKRAVPEILDCLSKTYAIWIQLQATVNDMEAQGHPAPLLRNSITLLEAGLGALEQEYAVAMGIDMPNKKARIGTSSSIQ